MEALYKSAAFERAYAKYQGLYFPKIYMGRSEDSYRAALRVYRSLVVYRNDGRVVSTEMFNRGIDRFADPDVRNANIAFKADNKTTFFNSVKRPSAVREDHHIVDYSGNNLMSTFDDQLTLLEIFINLENDVDGTFNKYLHPLEFADGDMEVDIPVPPIRPIHAEVRTFVYQKLQDDFLKEYKDKIVQFRSILDQRTLLNLEKACLNGCESFNWLSGYKDGRVDDNLALRRNQMCESYPLFSGFFSSSGGSIAEAVDNAEPVLGMLAEKFGVPEKNLKKIRGYSAQYFGMNYAPNKTEVHNLIEHLRHLPGQLKLDACDWRQIEIASSLYEQVKDVVPDLMERSVAVIPQITVDDIGDAGALWERIIVDLEQNVCKPVFLKNKVEYEDGFAKKMLVGNRNIKQIADAMLIWMNKNARNRAYLANKYPSDDNNSDFASVSWLALHKSFSYQTNTGTLYVFKPLTDSQMLTDEGRKMDHCVANYANICATGISHIVSIRVNERPVTTMEIDQKLLWNFLDNPVDFSSAPLHTKPDFIKQFYGHGNQVVTNMELRRAMWHYAMSLPSMKIKREELEMEQRLSKHGAYTTYNVKAPGAVEEAWRLYSDMLPKSIRNYSDIVSLIKYDNKCGKPEETPKTAEDEATATISIR